jgi:hypothetical protein
MQYSFTMKNMKLLKGTLHTGGSRINAHAFFMPFMVDSLASQLFMSLIDNPSNRLALFTGDLKCHPIARGKA